MNDAGSGMSRAYTTKQMGDACEMLVAAELTLAGIPALEVPDLWPGYDVVAQPIGREPQRISVKSRTFKKGAAFVEYKATDVFDWLAICILPAGEVTTRTIYIVPRDLADTKARKDKETSKTALLRYWRIDEVERVFGPYRTTSLSCVTYRSRCGRYAGTSSTHTMVTPSSRTRKASSLAGWHPRGALPYECSRGWLTTWFLKGSKPQRLCVFETARAARC
jgi:hypothetical protein